MRDAFFIRLLRYYGIYTAGFLAFLAVVGLLEHRGLPRDVIGYLFVFVTILLYAGIGVLSRTSDVAEYYVAGRRVPAMFNGMATAADWMSAATFISLAGGLYAMGFDGLAYIVGWTGGYCLIAFLIGPYLNKFGQYTIPDFLAARYEAAGGGHLVRVLAVIATVLVSFVYVVAQIYGVGLIVSRFTGVDFSIGIFLGLASILVCSFLGGMRAVTWTQVAQYIVIVIAYMTPVVWLSIKHTGTALPQISYGTALAELSAREQELNRDPAEQQIRAIFQRQAEMYEARLAALPLSWEQGRLETQARVDEQKRSGVSLAQLKAATRAIATYPESPEEARQLWTAERDANLARAAPVTPHATPFPGETRAASDIRRNNFLALTLCLMMGTAALPHILARFYTASSVQQARSSVLWTLFFVMLLYLSVPALAVLVKIDIYGALVGTSYSELPAWVSYWASIDKLNPLVAITDLNRDGIVQLAEVVMDRDIVVLATPEIAGLPYVISGLIAAGGLAAALSTADGLLLTISNALSHDIYYKTVHPEASSQKRLTISKLLLLAVALIAAYVASLKPGDILSMVGAAFSLASSALFPALVLGVFWSRANRPGAIAGMLTGFTLCVYYMVNTYPALGGSSANQWFHIAPMSAGIFGVPCGFLALVVVSLLTRAPDRRSAILVQTIRMP